MKPLNVYIIETSENAADKEFVANIKKLLKNERPFSRQWANYLHTLDYGLRACSVECLNETIDMVQKFYNDYYDKHKKDILLIVAAGEGWDVSEYVDVNDYNKNSYHLECEDRYNFFLKIENLLKVLQDTLIERTNSDDAEITRLESENGRKYMQLHREQKKEAYQTYVKH